MRVNQKIDLFRRHFRNENKPYGDWTYLFNLPSGSYTDYGYGMALDVAGNVYISGTTESTNFPTTAGAFQRVKSDSVGINSDVFVTKLNSAGNGLVYSTFIGGTGNEEARAISVDSNGNAWVAGMTFSTNYPVTPNAFQSFYKGNGGDNSFGDAFVTKLDSTGSSLLYSTYFGGINGETAYGLAVDSADCAYVAGFTLSPDFPVTTGVLQPVGALSSGGGGYDCDGFVSKFSPAGALIHSTFIGGSRRDRVHGIAVDAAGDAYLTGATESVDFPTTAQAFQRFRGDPFVNDPEALSNYDAFVAKLNPTATTARWFIRLTSAGRATIRVLQSQ